MAKQNESLLVRVRSTEHASDKVRDRAVKEAKSVRTYSVGPNLVETIIEFRKPKNASEFCDWIRKVRKADMELVAE